MLFDDALVSATVKRAFGPNYDRFRREMLKAQRFDLSEPFAAAVDEIIHSNMAAQYAARSLVRPTYDTTWWEVPHAYRPGFMRGEAWPGHRVPKRVGVLVQEFEEQPGAFLMSMFYGDRSGETAPCLVSIACDLTEGGRIRHSMGGPIGDPDSSFGSVFSPYASGAMRAAMRSNKSAFDSEQRNWQGEVRFWPVAMMLLNSRNVAYAEAEPQGKRHARMVKEGRSPLTTFSVCKIRMDRISRRGVDDDSPAGDAAVRAHFVRGHFKTRKSGIYWWRPFVRGDVKKGFAGKTYSVDGEP